MNWRDEMSCLGLGLDMHGRLLSAYVLAGYPTGVEGAQGGPGNNTPPPPPTRMDIDSGTAVRTVRTELDHCK